MDDTRILMVVSEPEARDAYEAALGCAGVSYSTAGSFRDALHMAVVGAFSGLLVDILTLIRSSKEEKNIAYECINFYPTLRMKWDARQKSISCSSQVYNASNGAAAALNHFVESRCRTFAARSLRRFNRKDTFLSLLLSGSPFETEGQGVKTFTVNVSQGGTFVHSTESFEKGSKVWLRVPELPAGQAFCSTVCWSIPWGGNRGIPGIGVMFDGLNGVQADWINRILAG